MSNEEEFIGTAEAAQVLGLERSVFTRKVNAGGLELEVAMRGSGTTGEKFFRRSDVEALASAPAGLPDQPAATSSRSGDAA